MTRVAVADVSDRKSSPLERSLLAIARSATDNFPNSMRARQREAVEWIERNGLTKARDDAWRNASTVELQQHSVTVLAAGAKAVAHWPAVALPDSGPVLWLVNGEILTESAPIAGVRWLALSKAIEQEPSVRAQFGAHVLLENGFTASNVAAFADGWCLIVEPGVVVERPIELRYLQVTAGASALALPRVLVLAGAGSQLQLFERHYSRTSETSLTAEVTEIVLEPGAKVTHSRWVDHGPSTWQVATTAVSVGEGAEYHAWTASGQGRFARHDLTVRLAGRRASAVLDGVFYARSAELSAQYVRVWHDSTEGSTKECYRGVVENNGRGIFDGIIYVGKGAAKTDARQENRNLLLGPLSIVHTKPHLEIDNDDVTCSHGATVGQLDEQQLFYLRARGIAEHEARAVLTWAFAKEIVDRCPNDMLGDLVREALRAKEVVE